MVDARRLQDVPVRPLIKLPGIIVTENDAHRALRRNEDFAQVGGDRWRVPVSHRS